jgi:hypothetical protein
MTTLRNTGDSPVRTRRIARVGQALGTAALAGGLAVLAACSDTPTASLAAPGHGPLLATTTAGDTTYTTFRIDPNDNGTIVIVGGVHKLDVPRGAVCDPATAGYGPTLWDAPCTPATSGVTFTAKSWFDSAGHPSIVISPDVRFVPGKAVTMFMKDKDAALDATSDIWYCPTGGTSCVNEATADPSLAPTRDGNGGYISRRVKHFSGYTVVFGADGGESEWMQDRASLAARASGYITTTGFDGGSATFEGSDRNR